MDIYRICSLIDGKLVADVACDIVGFYAGDFLSHIMLRPMRGYALLTVVDHVGVAVVAAKTGIGAVVLCDGVQPSDRLVCACQTKGIALVTTPLSAFECAAKLSK